MIRKGLAVLKGISSELSGGNAKEQAMEFWIYVHEYAVGFTGALLY